MQAIQRFLMISAFVCVSLCLAITLTIFVSPLIYSSFIDVFNLEAISGLSALQLRENYQVMLDYLINPRTTQLIMPYFSSSASGLQHFAEVKFLFFINFIASGILLFATGFSIRTIRKHRWQLQMNFWFVFGLMLPLLLLLFIVVAFDQVFIIFHQVLFNNDLWLFNPALDPVITVLPQEFFMVLFIIALLFYEFVLFIIRFITNWKV